MTKLKVVCTYINKKSYNISYYKSTTQENNFYGVDFKIQIKIQWTKFGGSGNLFRMDFTRIFNEKNYYCCKNEEIKNNLLNKSCYKFQKSPKTIIYMDKLFIYFILIGDSFTAGIITATFDIK